MPLTYRSENHESMLSLIGRFAFDKPKSSIFYPNNHSFSVSGWCVPSNPSDKVSVFVEHANKPQKIYDLSIDRPDVINSLKIKIEEYSYKKFGFDITIEADNLKSVGFIINSSTCIEAWSYVEPNKDTTTFGNSRENPLRSTNKNILEESIHIFIHQKKQKNINYKEINEIALSEVESFNKVAVLLKKNEEFNTFHNTEIVDLVKMIQAETSENKWNDNAIKRLRNGGELFSSAKGAMVYGNFIAGDICYLLVSLNGYFFYFVQYCGNIGVFFPVEKTFFSFTKIDSWTSISVDKINEILHLTIKKFISNNYSFIECKFSGALLAQARPYHFFYDGLYSLASIALDSPKQPPLYVKFIQEYCFIEPSNVFSEKEFIFEKISKTDFNRKQSEASDEFYILACNQYHLEKKSTTIDFLDKKIINSTINSTLKNSEILKKLLISSNFILWIGISSEKRQIDELPIKIKELVDKLNKHKSARLTICFDGRTFPLIPSEQDKSFFDIETRKIKEIQSLLPSNVVCLNLSGMNSIDKLFIAKKIDYFFCSFATDSLYVSRICKKPGFAYYPINATGALEMHIHPKSELIKCETVQHANENPWHMSDSIIDWDLLASRIESHFIGMEAASD